MPTVNPMTISQNKVSSDKVMQQENQEAEKEERIYVAGQILGGNLDKELHTLYIVEEDVKNGQPPPDLVEKRGRAVLEIFHLANNKGHDIPSNNQADHIWAEATTAALASQKDPLGIPSTTKSKSTKELMWKILYPPIVSMAHVGIANGLVDGALKCDDTKIQRSMYGTAKIHLQSALQFWTCNPSAMLALANLTRMGVVPIVESSTLAAPTQQTDDASVRRRMELAMQQYLAAAKCATSVRRHGIQLLVGPNKLKSTDDLFLVETIVLGLAAQVDAVDDNVNDDDSKNDEEYGQSKVVSTASYMAALLASTLGHHTVAKEALAAFGNNVTRIHPSVWDAAARLARNPNDDESTTTKLAPATEGLQATAGAFTPSIFRQAIPKDLARILRHAFRPDAPYWDQSAYDRGVYYSFWHDYHRPPKEAKDTTTMTFANAIEELITSYLLPRVKHVVGEKALSELAGFEWWVHTRPHGANLGHQLHFDTDEALLEQDQIVSFPISATVLYLNADDDEEEGEDDSNHQFGATVLFDQTPYCQKNADRAWISTPKPRSFLVFPGDLLHGVLPCAPVGGDTTPSHNEDSTTNKNNKTRNKRKLELISEANTGDSISASSAESDGDTKDQKVEQPHRLTFMVNFWARNIPEKLKKRKLYGPSGPFPPMTRRHSWTNDLLDGGTYPRTVKSSTSSTASLAEQKPLIMGTLTCIEPAWELLNHAESTNNHPSHDSSQSSSNDNVTVDLPPSGINQRFFVKNAPDFFHSTLFEK